MSIAIPAALLFLSSGTALVIIIRKFRQLSLLDVDSIPEVQEEKKKNEFLKLRVEKRAEKAKVERAARWQPFWRWLREMQLKFRVYVGSVERSVRHEMETLGSRVARKRRTLGEAPSRTLLADAAFAFEQGNLEIAEQKYLSVIRQNPKNKEAYRGLGDIYARQGHAEEAAQTYKFVHGLDPADDNVLVKLSEVSESQGSPSAAVEYLSQALLLNDNIASRFAKMSELLLLLGQDGAALEAIEQAVELEPENPKYLDTLAEASILAGRKDAAEDAYKRLRMVNSDNQKLAMLKDKIGKME